MADESGFIHWAVVMRALSVSQALFFVFSARLAFPQRKTLLPSVFLVACFASYALLFLVAKDWLGFNLVFGLNLATPMAAFLFVTTIAETEPPERPNVSRYVVALLGVLFIAGYCATGLKTSMIFSFGLIGWNTFMVILCGVRLWRGYREDLNRARTLLRLVLSVGLVIYVVVVGLLTSLRLLDASSHNLLRAIEGGLLTVLGLMINAILVQPPVFNAAFLIDRPLVNQKPPIVRQVDELEALSNKVRQLMENDRLYLEQGLSLQDLADKLGTPVYRVRFLLNQHLGHENFAGFLNPYRLEHAAGLLTQPDKATEKIFAIALQSGFSSLAPFNKAFKARYGLTPSEYRDMNLNKA